MKTICQLHCSLYVTQFNDATLIRYSHIEWHPSQSLVKLDGEDISDFTLKYNSSSSFLKLTHSSDIMWI